jgi:hypothetical protein
MRMSWSTKYCRDSSAHQLRPDFPFALVAFDERKAVESTVLRCAALLCGRVRGAPVGFEGRDSHRTIFASAWIIDHHDSAYAQSADSPRSTKTLSAYPFLFARRQHYKCNHPGNHRHSENHIQSRMRRMRYEIYDLPAITRRQQR